MPVSTSTLVIASLFPIFFVGLWLAVTALIARFSGWALLEEYLADRSGVPLDTLRFQGFYLGKGKLGTSYRGCVTFEVCKDGLRVRIWKLMAPFSSPIFIPWDKMQAERAKIMAFSAIRLKIGLSGEYWMTIAERTARRISNASGGAFALPAD